MDHKQKVDKMIQEFTEQGIKKRYLAPLDYRLLWKCGIKIAPPLFAPFLSLFVYFALVMTIITGFLCLLIPYLLSSSIDYESLVLMVSFSVFGGLGHATFYRSQAKKMNLPLWKDYLKNVSEGEAKKEKGKGPYIFQ